MKRSFKILLILSLIANCILAFLHNRQKRSRIIHVELAEAFKFRVLDNKWEKEKFFRKLKVLDNSSDRKKYFLIHIWDGYNGTTHQLPKFDSIVEPIRNDISYVLVNEENDNLTNYALAKDKVKIKNFVYMNNADSLMHCFYQEFKMKNKFEFLFSLPINIIMDRTGKILYADTSGRFRDLREDSLALDVVLKNLKVALKELK